MNQRAKLFKLDYRLRRRAAEDASPLLADKNRARRQVPVQQHAARAFECELEPFAAAAQRLFCEALGGDVLDHVHVAQQVARIHNGCGMQSAPDDGAVGMLVAVLRIERRVCARRAVPFAHEALAVFGMQRTAPAGAEHLVGGQPGELVEVGIAEDAGSACVDHEQSQRRSFADRAQACFALAQRAHALAPVGNVEDGAGDAIDVAACIERRISEDLDPARQSVAAQQPRRVA